MTLEDQGFCFGVWNNWQIIQVTFAPLASHLPDAAGTRTPTDPRNISPFPAQIPSPKTRATPGTVSTKLCPSLVLAHAKRRKSHPSRDHPQLFRQLSRQSNVMFLFQENPVFDYSNNWLFVCEHHGFWSLGTADSLAPMVKPGSTGAHMRTKICFIFAAASPISSIRMTLLSKPINFTSFYILMLFYKIPSIYCCIFKLPPPANSSQIHNKHVRISTLKGWLIPRWQTGTGCRPPWGALVSMVLSHGTLSAPQVVTKSTPCKNTACKHHREFKAKQNSLIFF